MGSGTNGADDHFIDPLMECYARIKVYSFGCLIRKDDKVEGELISVVQVRHKSRKPIKIFGP